MKVIRVLGMGNILNGDDGIGVHVLNELRRKCLPENIELIDIGSQVLDILSFCDGAEKIIIIDAARNGNKPGHIYHIGTNDLSHSSSFPMVLHNFKLSHILRTSKKIFGKDFLKRIVIIGVEVNNIEPKIGLSKRMVEVMSRLVVLILNEIKK